MLLREVGRGIAFAVWTTFRRAGSALLFIAAIALLGSGLALPLWAFASYQPKAYTLFALVILATGVLFLVVRRTVRRSREAGGFAAWLRVKVLPALRKTAIALVFGAASYGALVLLVRGRVLAGVLLSGVIVVFGGYLGLVRRRGE